MLKIHQSLPWLQSKLGNEKALKKALVVYIGDFTIQLYRDDKKPFYESPLNKQDSMESKRKHQHGRLENGPGLVESIYDSHFF